MKIIFLDIDGVLNHALYIKSNMSGGATRGEECISPKALNLLRHVVDNTNAKIVISSTWRIGRTMEWFIELFDRKGWSDAPIVGLTPIKGQLTRGEEIDLFISNFEHRISKHVILDDDSDFRKDQPLIKTTWETGLLPSHCYMAMSMLT